MDYVYNIVHGEFIFEIDLSVIKWKSEGNVLPLSINEHWVKKKRIKNS